MFYKKEINIFILIFGILFAGCLFAQDASFTASVSKNKVAAGEQFQIVFTINTNASNFSAPDLSNFYIYSGPNQSTSMNIVNGSMSQSVSINYIVAAKKEGRYTIGPASIRVGSKTLNTKSISIEVTKGNASSGGNSSNTNTNQNNTNSPYPEDVESNIFMRVIASKSKLYIGEQLLVTYKVYTRLNIVDNALSKAPSFNGFWSEEVPNPTRQTELRTEVLDGIQYQVAEIKKTILIPQKSGTLTIDPLEMDIVMRVKSKSRSNSIFDQFFGGGYQDVKLTIASKPLKVEIMPLPEKGRPVDFSGAVGQLKMEATIKNNELKTDDACNLTYTISGKGNLKLLEAFKLNLPTDIESYDPKITDKINVSADGVSGSRSFEYLLIPRHAGNFALPPIAFSYFDPQKRAYITLPASEFQLKVSKGLGNDGMVVSRETNKQDIKITGNDIRYIKTNIPKFIPLHNTFLDSNLFWVFILFPIIVYLIFFIWYRKYKKQMADAQGVKRRKANSMAQKQLKIAQEFLSKNEYNPFFEELFKALYGYLSNKLSLSQSELNKSKIEEMLSQKGVELEPIQKIINVLETCEFARFAPVKDEKKMKQAYQDAIEIISLLEDKLKNKSN